MYLKGIVKSGQIRGREEYLDQGQGIPWESGSINNIG